VRTVSAAAGGTVPVEGMITGTARKGEEGDGLVGRLDLWVLRNKLMIS